MKLTADSELYPAPGADDDVIDKQKRAIEGWTNEQLVEEKERIGREMDRVTAPAEQRMQEATTTQGLHATFDWMNNEERARLHELQMELMPVEWALKAGAHRRRMDRRKRLREEQQRERVTSATTIPLHQMWRMLPRTQSTDEELRTLGPANRKRLLYAPSKQSVQHLR